MLTLTHDLEVNSAVFDPSGMVVLTASQDRSAKLWDATSGEAQGRQNRHQSWMICGSLLDRCPSKNELVSICLHGNEWY